VPISLVGFIIGGMYDYVWLELLSGGVLASALMLGSSDERDEDDDVFWDFFDDSDDE